jgi:hypothetical protein
MADQPGKVREVAWSELFPWLMLIRTVRIALMARVLLLAALGLIVLALGWRIILWTTGTEDEVVRTWYADSSPWIWERMPEFRIPPSARSAREVFDTASTDLIEAPLAIWLYFANPFIHLFSGELTPSGFVILLICCVWELLVWGLVGGAITRIAALRLTRDEAPPFLAALKHAGRKLPSYSVPPLVALAGAAVFAVQLAVLGLLMRLDVLALLAGVIWPFVLLLGLLMAILLLGALIGFPLMWATVSVEGTDAFDALSRSYAYVYHRPWRLLCYVLFAALLAIVSMFVVKLFAASAMALGDWSIDWGIDETTMRTVVSPRSADTGSDAPLVPPLEPLDADMESSGSASAATDEQPQQLNALLRGARGAIGFWKSLVAALAAGYQAGFLWTSAVGVYLLMRRDVDGVQLNEVYIDPADEYGMPPLADEATTNVGEIAAGEPARPGDTGAAT